VVGFDVDELVDGGFTAKQLLETGIDTRQLAARYSISQLQDAGLDARQLNKAGISLQQLADAYGAGQLLEGGFQVQHLLEVGLDPRQLKAAGSNALQLLQAGLDVRQLKQAGFDAKELWTSGIDLKELIASGFQAEQLTGSFNARQLRGAGFDAAALHIIIHLLAVEYVLPFFARSKSHRSDLSYADEAAEQACTWFNANPVHCLRSQNMYKHKPHCAQFVRGKEHLQIPNPEVGTYFHDERPLPEESFY